MYENFSRDDVIDFKIIKSKYAAPIPDIKTINNLPKLKSLWIIFGMVVWNLFIQKIGV